MESTNLELHQLIANNVSGSNINQISMKIKGVLDAEVNGGFRKYEEAFLTIDYLEKHPGNEQFVQSLRAAKTEQNSLLKQGIISRMSH
jgi:hypothetical protein